MNLKNVNMIARRRLPWKVPKSLGVAVGKRVGGIVR